MQYFRRNPVVGSLLAALIAFGLMLIGVSNFIVALVVMLLVFFALFGSEEEGFTIHSSHEPIKKANRRILQLANRFSTSFLFLSHDGRIVYLNKAMREKFPHMDKDMHFSQITRSTVFIETLRNVLEGGNAHPFNFVTQRGSERIFEATVSPFGKKLQEVTGAGWLLEIRERTQELKSDLMRREFVANASHELRTPLTSIIGGLETIETQSKEDTKTLEHFLPIMSREAERMKRLVEDLMALSQIELAEHLPPTKEVDMKEVIAQSVSSLESRADSANVSIINNVTQSIRTIGDQVQLEQVFLNIIDNAIKYGNEGGEITIFPAAASPIYRRKIGFWISDQSEGIGIAEIPRLTERFYRVSADISREKGGTGLGLAIVKHILRRHGGELQITSRIGEGSVFTVWLPEQNN